MRARSRVFFGFQKRELAFEALKKREMNLAVAIDQKGNQQERALDAHNHGTRLLLVLTQVSRLLARGSNGVQRRLGACAA